MGLSSQEVVLEKGGTTLHSARGWNGRQCYHSRVPELLLRAGELLGSVRTAAYSEVKHPAGMAAHLQGLVHLPHAPTQAYFNTFPANT